MTFTILRSLVAIIGDALDEMEQVYRSQGCCSVASESESVEKSPSNSSADRLEPNGTQHKSTTTSHAYASPPPSPSVNVCFESFAAGLDFPSLDAPCDPTSPAEALTSHPTVMAAISRIIAAAGQLAASVQSPFLTLCDATMGYHLPSCMRLLEASHVVEILREAGSQGLHVSNISMKNGVDANKLAHILRLLATHHILRELSPDVFALNRISSLVDSGKSFADLQQYQADGQPELKYKDTNGIAAFVGLCTDELQKSAAYMTETYYLSPSEQTRAGTDPTRAPFCFAFNTVKSNTGFFGWLEGEVHKRPKYGDTDPDDSVEIGPGALLPPVRGVVTDPGKQKQSPQVIEGCSSKNLKGRDHRHVEQNPNKFRLERFGKAMSGTDGWEAPGAILNGFDWHSLPPGGIVVDVGGGIGSTAMLLATAFSSSAPSEDAEILALKFVIQDRPVVCEMGEKAWKAKCPELLDSAAKFQVHDFFTPQPIKNADLFLLRVVLHDWPDEFARQILLHLREAATPSTKLLIADFVLPLACPDSMTDLEDVEGAEGLLVPSPLLPNLGKGSANVYWMDMTMQVVFNSQERTLRELVTLSASAGWKVTKVTRTTGSLFGYLVAVPVNIPKVKYEGWPIIKNGSESSPKATPIASQVSTNVPENICFQERERKCRNDLEVIERASSRCGTPTFGSNTRLSSVQEALARFGGGIFRKSKGMTKTLSTPSSFMHKEPPPVPLKPALTLSSGGGNSRKKAKPSPLSIVPVSGGPSSPGASSLHTPSSATIPPLCTKGLSPKPERSPSGHTHSNSSSQAGQPSIPAPGPLKKGIPRRLSLANLRPTPSQSRQPPPPLPTFTFTRQPPASPNTLAPPPVPNSLPRRLSHAHLSHAAAAAAAAAYGQPQMQANNGQGLLAPSFIPIRAGISQNELAESGTRSGSNPSNSILFAPVTPQRTIPRKSSYAQLPQPSALRARSGTFTGGGLIIGPSNTSRKNDFSIFPGASTSKSKSCGTSPATAGPHVTESLPSPNGSSEYVPGGLLAAAARSERGEFGQD